MKIIIISLLGQPFQARRITRIARGEHDLVLQPQIPRGEVARFEGITVVAEVGQDLGLCFALGGGGGGCFGVDLYLFCARRSVILLVEKPPA